MTERMQNVANSYIGAAKQTIGETLGYPDLAASGANQKEQAEANQKMADAKTQLHGVGHSLQGQVEQAVGSFTQDPAMEARGKANITKGDMQQQQGSHPVSPPTAASNDATKETREGKPLA
ncbi:hypothetical protein EMPS_04512 [Entomortierella parvispora]|uniref:CsbD-like domain-containing protein n=1 Tax=Entomortierella parvispora TaxID=205924 RepID=A0A9P3H8U3_9FUNG|nr:hypothetical protein EMPS_04512 [Entomortierella parvispora]